MNRTVPVRCLLFGCSSVLLALAASSVAAEEFTIGDRTLKVADGYEVERVTTPELVERPIAVSRDERGRLYVTDSGGMTERAEQQLEKKPHRIRRLEDTDGDGHYDRSTLFADRMMFPEGCLWYEGSLYVAAPPEIWKLTDDNDDGVADRREVWFDGTTLTGCGNDLHGPYAGPDGRIYWCKGAFAEQRHRMSDGSELVTRSSHIFRSRPDGTAMESVLTGGMDNPVNVAFLPNGERFLSCTFFQFPEAGRRDGLIHAIYGGVYGKAHDSILAHPRTGTVMPVLNHQGAAAPCGLIAGSSSVFGGGSEQTLFACYFNLHKVVRHRLIPDGPTYTTEDTDFLSCDHPDFHPTDVFEDADGSLLIVDTGGWYKVCCPTSQLAKPDVLGAVYRVRRKGQPEVMDPLGLELNRNAEPPELVTRLSDPRLFVRQGAAAALRKTGPAGISALDAAFRSSTDAAHRNRIILTLSGMEEPDARDVIRLGLTDPDETVCRSAIQAAGLWRDRQALDELLRQVSDHSGDGIQRAAAEAIGRMADPRAVPVLFEALAGLPASPIDSSGAPANAAARISEHALIFAVLEINNSDAAIKGLQSRSPAVIRAALVALDQMADGHMSPADVVSRMSHPDPAVRATAVWIIDQHPDWGSELTEFFAQRASRFAELTEAERDQDRALLASLAGSPDIQALLLRRLDPGVSSAVRRHALQVLAETRLSAVPAGWLDALAGLLVHEPAEELGVVVRAAEHLPQPKDGHPALRAAMQQVGAREDVATELRLLCLKAAGEGLSLTDGTFLMLTNSLKPDLELGQRSQAAGVLAVSALTDSQRQQLLQTLSAVGPMELPKLLPAFEREPADAPGLALVAALETSPGLRGLRADQVQSLLAKYSPTVQEAGRSLLKQLNASLEEQTSMLESLLTSLPDGDIRRGHEVFMGRKAACQTCHKLGYGGGRLGPDLTNLGRVRNRRDVLEALVFPSASIVRGYEPVSAELNDGRVISGIITSESAHELVISIDAEKSATISRDSIAELSPSAASPMPNGLATLLTRQELADLVAFLLTDQR